MSPLPRSAVSAIAASNSRTSVRQLAWQHPSSNIGGTWPLLVAYGSAAVLPATVAPMSA